MVFTFPKVKLEEGVDADGLQYLSEARALAARWSLAEVALKPQSRMVSFTGTAASGQAARWNVYYTTRTVGTCLEHPRQGKTQMFRRHVSPQQLEQIFADPRVHTGNGYQRVSGMPSSPHEQAPPAKARRLSVSEEAVVVEGSTWPESPSEEEQAVEALLGKAELEVVELRAWRDQLRSDRWVRASQVRAEAEERARVKREAEVAAAWAKAEAEAAAKREASRIKAEAEAAAARAKAEAEAAAARAKIQAEARERERLRGTRATYSLCSRESDSFDECCETDASFALGCADSNSGQGTYVRLRANGGWTYCGNVPIALDNALKGRSVNLPSPRYVQLGWDSEWILVFENGVTKWGGMCSSFTDAFNDSDSAMRFCAIGEGESWYIEFQNGTSQWQGLSDDMSSKIRAGNVAFLSLGPNDSMFIRYDTPVSSNGRKFAWSNAPDGAMREVNRLHGNGWDVRSVHFGINEQYIIKYSSS
jgi:hypothetical protein